MEENKKSNFWKYVIAGAIIYFVANFLGNYGKYQGKSAQDWYNAYANEQSKVESLNQSLQNANNQLKQEDQQKSDLQTCLDTADSNYISNWAYACTKFGLSDKGANCTLPAYNANTFNNTLQQDKNNCFKQYPQK